MCGISGILVKDNQNLSHEIVAINNRLKHRGPDDEGYALINKQQNLPFGGNDTPHETLENTNVYCPKELIYSKNTECFLALGHRRLSIIDTSANGHQPMCSHDQKIWIALNGEIYNYIELKKELIDEGYKFRTQSDTEVVIAAYKKWGEECVSHFNGMWAFVLYDADKQILFGSRDRLGVKPLYYYKNNELFVFASEQKALWASNLVKSEINSRAVFDYLALSHSEPEEEGFFKNIRSLKQGHNFTISTNNLIFNEYCYYDTRDIKEAKKNKSIEYEADYLLNLLNDAIKIRTRADVEIGACLSGGIDSSFIVMLLDKYFNEKKTTYQPKVFTAIYPNYHCDEEKWAKNVVDLTQVKWFKTQPTGKEFLTDISDLIYYADTPILTTSTYAQYRVMKEASEQGIKVLLDGQGADELFAGYDVFDNVFYNELFLRFKYLIIIKELKSEGNGFSKLKNWIFSDLRVLLQKTPSKISKFLYEKAVNELKYLNREFKQEYLNQYGKVHFPYGSNLNKVLKQYAGGEKLQVLLRLEDRMSMRFSVESRTPFADDLALINYGLSLPSDYKIKNGMRKFILREAGKNILPQTIKNRRDKIGFQTPEYEWLKSLKNEIPTLLESNIEEYVNTSLIKNDLIKVLDHPTSIKSSRLLRFVFLSQWRKVYNI